MSKRSLIICVTIVLFFLIPATRVEGTSYLTMNFADELGDPITTALDLRISLWNIYKQQAQDMDAEGNIIATSPHYGGYQTILTITPDEYGHFVPEIDGFYQIHPLDLPAFPEIGPHNAFAQVEYKAQGAPNTAYTMYDFVADVPYNNVERLLLDSNAAYYVLDAGPQTNWNTFTIDDNNNSTTAIKLQFGDLLNESLQWNMTNTRFELSHSLYVDGSIKINGKLDFNLNEMVQARLENRDSAPNCNSSSMGRVYFNTTDFLPYYCNGTTWNTL